MLAVYDDAASSKYQVKYCSNWFMWSRECNEVIRKPGRPLEMTIPEIC
jgi:hypothetical protein